MEPEAADNGDERVEKRIPFFTSVIKVSTGPLPLSPAPHTHSNQPGNN